MPLKSRQLETLLAERSRKTSSEVDQIMRRLRDADRISSGPRGVHAPALTSVEAAQILVTVCGAVSAGDAVSAWSCYTRPVSRRDGRPLIQAIAESLEGEGPGIRHILVWTDSFSVEIVRPDGTVELFARPGDAPPQEAFDDKARDVAFIGGGLIREIAEALK